ncbi:hypothetical protein ACLB2K_034503 [Fragaria x ananassa]
MTRRPTPSTRSSTAPSDEALDVQHDKAVLKNYDDNDEEEGRRRTLVWKEKKTCVGTRLASRTTVTRKNFSSSKGLIELVQSKHKNDTIGSGGCCSLHAHFYPPLPRRSDPNSNPPPSECFL